MAERDELLAAILAKLRQVTEARDTSLALDPGTLGDAVRLREMLPDDDWDLQARFALGWLHWYRYQALPDGQGQPDLDAATAVFIPCFVTGAGELPGPLRPRLASKTAPIATAMLQQALNSNDAEFITATIDLWRRILDPLSSDKSNRALILSNIGAALNARFKVTGDRSDLDEAIETARSAAGTLTADSPDRARIVSNLGAILNERFELGRAPEDLDAAIEAGQTTVAAAGPEHPDRGGMLSNLAGTMHSRFQRDGNVADLDESIRLARAGVAATPPDNPRHSGILANFEALLREKFQHTDDLADLDAAIAAHRSAVTVTPASHPGAVRTLRNLTWLLNMRFERTGAATDLDAAIDIARQAVADTSDTSDDSYVAQANLAALLNTRFRSASAPSDLTDAIEVINDLLKRAPSDHPNRAVWMSDLGGLLHSEFERTKASADLDAAIAAIRPAVIAAIGTDHEERATIVSNLRSLLHERYELTGNLADLDEAIEATQSMVATLGPDHSRRARLLSGLAADLGRRFERTGRPADLDAAIETGREAVEVAPEGHPDHTEALSNLGEELRTRFGATGLAADIEAAIEIGRAALQATPDGDAARAGRLANLGAALRARYDGTGSLEDLNAAIGMAHAAIDATPDEDPRRARYLSNLTVALTARFERTGALEDLDAAIEAGRAAVGATRSGHPSRVWRLANLAMAFDTRFERTGVLEDLDAAIEVGRAAVAATPEDHAERGKNLVNLGISLYSRYRRIGSAEDLDAAAETVRAALAVTPEDHARWAGRLSNLGMILRARFSRNANQADLEAAIAASRQAVAATPEGHPDRPMRVSNLSVDLWTRFQDTQDPQDLSEALEAAQAAVDDTPVDHPLRARYLFNLGLDLRGRFRQSQQPGDREAAISAFTAAAELASASPELRISAGRAAGHLAADVEPSRAARLLAGAVELLNAVAPRRLARGDQQYAISGFAGLASDAAALTLLTGPGGGSQAAQALRLLEAGRMVLLSQMLDARGDLTDLRQQYPGLAERFVQLRDRLDAGDPAAEGPEDAVAPDLAPGRTAEDRRRLAADLAKVLAEIRGQDGFSSFGLPPTDEELLAEAALGPVVTFNVSSYGSSALLLSRDGISSVNLPGLAYDDVINQVNSFHEARRAAVDPAATASTRIGAQHAQLETLKWLWDVAAGPVLEALGYREPHAAGTAWPRVWWAAGGLLGLLPIHASGHHTELDTDSGSRLTVLDRVISSYTPTIRSLRYARQNARRAAAPTDRALIVAMPVTPGLPGSELPNVPLEVTRVRALLAETTLLAEPAPVGDQLSGSADIPTRANVFDQLPSHPVAHFACHGYSDPQDPSKSQLLLHDHDRYPLTVASLSPIDLGQAQLAYLSACETALTSATELIDEAIHLTTAFQIAGYPHVIGTMWEISDRIAVNVADDFYAGLRSASDTGLDTSKAALALHNAVRAVRDDHPWTPSLWAAYLHAGA